MKHLTHFLRDSDKCTSTKVSIDDFKTSNHDVTIKEDLADLSIIDIDTISHYTNITSQTIGDFMRTNDINTKKIISVLKDGSLKKRIEISIMILSDNIKKNKNALIKTFRHKRKVSEDFADISMADIQTISNYTRLTKGIIVDFAKANNVDTKQLISILITGNIMKIIAISTMILTNDIKLRLLARDLVNKLLYTE